MKKLILLPAILFIATTSFAQIMLMPSEAEIEGDPSSINEVHIEFRKVGKHQYVILIYAGPILLMNLIILLMRRPILWALYM